MPGDLTTLTNIRRIVLGTSDDSVDTGDDALLQRHIASASAFIERHANRRFNLYYQARTHDYDDPVFLDLNEDLLELDSLTNGDADSSSIATSDVLQMSANSTPKWQLKIKASASDNWTYSDDPEQAITVTGWWGYHTDYASALVDTLENVPAGDISAAATTFTATDVDGLDTFGRQRFEVGCLIRIEDELIKVVGRNTSTQALTIRRAQQGTTAAAHSEGADIYVWRPLSEIEWLCERLTLWAYKHQDAVNAVTFLDTNITLTDRTINDLVNKIEQYQPVRVRGVH